MTITFVISALNNELKKENTERTRKLLEEIHATPNLTIC